MASLKWTAIVQHTEMRIFMHLWKIGKYRVEQSKNARDAPKFSVRNFALVRSADKNIEDTKISRRKKSANILLKSFIGKTWIVISRIESQFPCNARCMYAGLHKKQWNSSKSDNCKLKGFGKHCSKAVIRISTGIEIEYALIFVSDNERESGNRIELFYLDSGISLKSKEVEIWIIYKSLCKHNVQCSRNKWFIFIN